MYTYIYIYVFTINPSTTLVIWNSIHAGAEHSGPMDG